MPTRRLCRLMCGGGSAPPCPIEIQGSAPFLSAIKLSSVPIKGVALRKIYASRQGRATAAHQAAKPFFKSADSKTERLNQELIPTVCAHSSLTSRTSRNYRSVSRIRQRFQVQFKGAWILTDYLQRKPLGRCRITSPPSRQDSPSSPRCKERYG
jgi:hypothetical protein